MGPLSSAVAMARVRPSRARSPSAPRMTVWMPGDRVRVIPTPRSSSAPSALANSGAAAARLRATRSRSRHVAAGDSRTSASRDDAALSSAAAALGGLGRLGAEPVPLGGVVLRAGGAASLGAFTTLAQRDRNLRDRAIPPARGGRHLVAGVGDDAEVAGAVQAEGRDEDVVGGGIVAGVEPAREPEQVLAPGKLAGGGTDHPLGVGEQGLQRPEGGVPELADLAALTRIVEEPGVQAGPVVQVAAPAALDLDLGAPEGL